jgi:serine beta-lactamase-like protein LACTB
MGRGVAEGVTKKAVAMQARWRRRLGLATAFAFAAAAGVARAQAAAAPGPSSNDAIERARALIDHEMTRTLAPAVSVAVSRNGRGELAGHLAGIRHYDHGEFEIRDHYATVRAGLATFEKDALLFEPGTQFSYSSYGWNLIAAVIEGASGERFLDVMQKRVFGPAGLVHTAPDDPGPIVAGRAHFYTRTDTGAIANAGFVDNSYKWVGGGFVSTAEDLVAFANALLEGRLVKPETVTLLWTSQKTSDGKDTEYGMGWSVGRDARGRRKISHSGGAQGGTAYLVIDPDDGLAAAMIVNSDESFTGRTPRIAEMFLDGE